MQHWNRRLSDWLKTQLLGERLVRRNPLYYPAAVRTFFALQKASLEERRAFTERRLKAVLRAAARTPYGRPFRNRPLEEWPLLDKDRVRGHEHEFLTRPAWLTSQGSTGGTMGIPLKLYRSLQSICYEQATYDYPLLKRGLNPLRLRIAVLRGDNVKDPSDFTPPFWRFTNGGQKLILSSVHLAEKTVSHYYAILKEFRPDCLFCYPATLEPLCLLLSQRGYDLHIPLVIATSEAMSSQARRLAAEVLKADVLHSYGAGERVAFAWSERPDEYYMFAGYGWVEFVPVERETDSILYEIVGTGLWNLAMPLVRYRMGDFVRLPASMTEAEIEEIRWGIRPFEGVLGRADDEYLLSPDGVHIVGMDHLAREVDNIIRMQVIQETLERVRILVIPDKGFSQTNLEQIMQNARRKIPSTMQVRIEVVDELIRIPNGKTPFVIREFERTTN